MKIAATLFVACAAVFVGACSSPAVSDEAADPASSAPTPERVVVAASPETRSTLGVTRWGISTGDERSTIVRGYDANTEVIVEYEQLADRAFRGESNASAFPNRFTARLRVRGHASTLQVEASATEHRVSSNDFTAETRQALGRIEADLRDQPASPTSPSLTTRNLVDGNGACLAQTCDNSLRASGATGSTAAGACVDGNGSCGRHVADTQTAQGAADAGCQCGMDACLTGAPISGPAVRPHVQEFANDACCAVTGANGAPGACHATTYDGHSPVAELAIDMATSPGGYGDTSGDPDFGDRLAGFAVANMAKYRIEYVIWQGRISFGESWKSQGDKGSPTKNHMDHVHVSFLP